MCNPIKVLSAIVTNANKTPSINLDYYIEPDLDRNTLSSELMPTSLLNNMEIQYLVDNVQVEIMQLLLSNNYTKDSYINAKEQKDIKLIKKMLPFISEEVREYLSLREVGQIRQAKTPYKRR